MKISIGISTCLLGEKVRFDAGHKRDLFITDILGVYFSFVPVCPEIDIGMGVPRESVRLVGAEDSPKMLGARSNKDWTHKMNRYAIQKVKKIDKQKLRGFILKKDSPSCGMERVRVYNDKGMAVRNGRGLFAKQLLDKNPLLPVEEEGRLNDPNLRDNFIVRVFAYDRLLNLFDNKFKRGEVVEFHSTHKYLIMAHSLKHYKLMGQLVAAIKNFKPNEFKEKYSTLFMEALQVKTTINKNLNVLMHIMGYMKNSLSSSDKKYILNIIEDYRNQLVPLIVPITLIRHYIEKHNVEYITNQYYLNPHPKELMLRNHV